MSDSLGFSASSTFKLLKQLGDICNHIVLIGGQAVNVWAEFYLESDTTNTLRRYSPFTSKDIDFTIDQKELIEKCAARINGDFSIAKPGHAISNLGKIVFMGENGQKGEIDFIEPFGLSSKEVFQDCIHMNKEGFLYKIMNPIHCLKSRVINVVALPDTYKTSHGLFQLEASIICAREFMRALLNEAEMYQSSNNEPEIDIVAKAKLKINEYNESIFSFCMNTDYGRRVFAETGLEPFDSLLIDSRLNPKFLNIRYGYMKANIGRLREKEAAKHKTRKA